MIDHDDWAKTDCQCGHRRYAHSGGVGSCTRTKKTPAQPEVPCPCRAFFDAEEALAESRGEW